MKTNLKAVAAGVLSLLMGACATTEEIAMVNEGNRLELYSSSTESGSVMNITNSTKVASVIEKSTAAKKKNFKELINLAELHLAKSELDKAEQYVRESLKIQLGSKRSQVILANIYLRRGQPGMAEIILNNLGGMKSKDSRILNLLALVSLKKQENGKAMFLFKEALKGDSANVAIRMNLGTMYFRYKQLRQAAVQFERVLKVIPNHTDAKMHLAAIMASRGQSDAAEKLFEEVASKAGDDSLAAYNYAVFLGDQGEYEDSLDALKEFVQTSKVRTRATERAFALMQYLNDRLASESDKLSDSEIAELSSDLNRREENQKSVAAVAKEEPVEVKEPEKKVIKKPEPKTVAKTKAPSKKKIQKVKKAPEPKPAAEESIDDLEKALMGH